MHATVEVKKSVIDRPHKMEEIEGLSRNFT